MLAVGTRHILVCVEQRRNQRTIKGTCINFSPLQPLKKILMRLRRGFKEFSMEPAR